MIRNLAAVALCALTLASPSVGEDQQSAPAFFFTVRIDLNADGSGSLRLTYPKNPYATYASERDRFQSPVTQVTDVQMTNDVIRTTVEFSDVTRISEARELASITVGREKLSGGEERIRARLRSPTIYQLASQEKLAISVSLPGPIVAANTKEINGPTAVWRPAAREYFTSAGISLEATYRPNVKATESKS